MIVFKATQDKVLAALQSVAGIVERRHTLPILANVLLRSEQGAQALMARGGYWLAPHQLHQMAPIQRWPNGWAAVGLLVLLLLRWKVGAL